MSDVAGAGDVAVITGAFTGNEVAGAVTRFENFGGDRLSRRYGPAEGQLDIHNSGVRTRDLVIEAEFANPTGDEWYYGFAIRNRVFGHLEIVGLTDRKWWFHQTRDVGDDEYTDVASGYLRDAGISLRSRNHLVVIAFEESGWFFVNERLAAKLDLGHNLDSGEVSAMGGFFEGGTGKIRVEGFNVWAP